MKSRLLAFVCVITTITLFPQLSSGQAPNYRDAGEFISKKPGINAGLAKTLSYPGASAVRVYFSNWEIAPGDTLFIRSAQDGDVQKFTQETLSAWSGTSAYFNGESVSVWLSGNSEGVSTLTSDIIYGEFPDSFAAKDVCAPDEDRVAGTLQSVGRLVENGGPSKPCTGWLTTGGFMISAMHCSDEDFDIIEFNVPNSNSTTGVFNHPSADDQYIITTLWGDAVGSLEFDPNNRDLDDLGQDWWIFYPGVNASGETPFENQSDFLRIASESSTSFLATISGYGGAGAPSGAQNGIHRKASGSVIDKDSSPGGDTFFTHLIDTEGGVSGGPMVHNSLSPATAVGIHVVGLCNQPGWDNYATSVDTPDLANAIKYFYSTSPYRTLFLDDNHPEGASGTGVLQHPYDTIGSANSGANNGEVLYLNGGSYTTSATLTKDLTLLAHSGTVTLGSLTIANGSDIIIASGDYILNTSATITVNSGGTLTIEPGVTFLLESGATIDVDSGGSLSVEDVIFRMKSNAQFYVEGALDFDGVTVQRDGASYWNQFLISGAGADDASIIDSAISGANYGTYFNGADDAVITNSNFTLSGLSSGLRFNNSTGAELTNVHSCCNYDDGLHAEVSLVYGLGGSYHDNGGDGIHSEDDNSVIFGDVSVDAAVVATDNTGYGLRMHNTALIDIGSLVGGNLSGGNSEVYDNLTKEAKVTTSATLKARNTYWNSYPKAPDSSIIEVDGTSTADWTNWLASPPSKSGSIGDDQPVLTWDTFSDLQAIRQVMRTDATAAIAMSDTLINAYAGTARALPFLRTKVQALVRDNGIDQARGLLTGILASGRFQGYLLSSIDQESWAEFTLNLALSHMRDESLFNYAHTKYSGLANDDGQVTFYLRLKERYRKHGLLSQGEAVVEDVVAGKTESLLEASAYPNPFNPIASIQVNLKAADEITVEVFNVLGQQIAILGSGQFQAGLHSFQFDASLLPSGIYLYNVSSKRSGRVTGRVSLIK